jgi:TonB family protein
MALSGNTRELSLADLILVKAHDGNNYRVRLTGPAGDGVLLLKGGRVVHASYGALPALDAAYLLVTEEALDYKLEADIEVPGQTIDLGAQELLMEAMRRYDEGILRRPKPVPVNVGAGVSSRREPPRPRSYDARKSPEAEALRRATGRVIFTEPDGGVVRAPKRSGLRLAAPVALLLAVALGYTGWRLGWLTPVRYRNPVRLSDLEGPRDALPVLLSGGPALAPKDSDANFHPTVLYRIRIDRRGKVYPLRPHESRPELRPFEERAAEALATYRFRPALREGLAVPVEMNWPVDFVRAPEPSPTPVPVDEQYFTDLSDRLPELVEGEPPIAPGRLLPKIRCRVLVTEEGSVAEARVLDSRPDRSEYEARLLEAVRNYRFTPGVREGQAVPTWTELTVEFRPPGPRPPNE